MSKASATVTIECEVNLEAFEKAEKATAELQIAIICKKIIQTKWWQFVRRNKLNKKATKIAKKYNIKY